MMPTSKLQIFVFSYNKGKFLDNCLKSALACAPAAKLTVVDDGSDDPETLDVLRKYENNANIVRADGVSGRRHGGLYENMQFSLEHFADSDYALFVQDDMQFVRKLSDEDFDTISDFFLSNKDAAFLHPCFQKGGHKGIPKLELDLAENFSGYFRKIGSATVGVFYSDVSIAKVDSLKVKEWMFQTKESINETHASENFSRMGYMKNPFLMWLPLVPIYRQRSKTFALQLAEYLCDAGLHPFDYLAGKELHQFLNRPREIRPYAEDFLRIVGREVKQPFRFSGLESYPQLKKLHKMELGIRRSFYWIGERLGD